MCAARTVCRQDVPFRERCARFRTGACFRISPCVLLSRVQRARRTFSRHRAFSRAEFSAPAARFRVTVRSLEPSSARLPHVFASHRASALLLSISGAFLIAQPISPRRSTGSAQPRRAAALHRNRSVQTRAARRCLRARVRTRASTFPRRLRAAGGRRRASM